MSVRTIFLMVRGIDQTGRAFNVIDRRIRTLIERQKELGRKTEREFDRMTKTQLKFLRGLRTLDRMAYRMIFAGAAFLVFAGMMAMGLANIIEKSSMGQLFMEDFGRAWEKLSVSVSEAILEQWGPAIKGFIEWLNELAQNETFMMVIGKVSIPAVLTIGVLGVSLLVIGLIAKFITGLVSLLEAAGYFGPAAKVTGLATGALKVLLPLTVLFSVIITLSIIRDQLRREVEEKIGVPVAEALQEYGFKKAFEGFDIGKAVGDFLGWVGGMLGGGAEFKGLPTGQLGTTFVPRTMPILAHEGEMIFNPRLPISPPAQMAGMMGRGVAGPIDIEINQYIDHVHTEADVEELANTTAERLEEKLREHLG